MNVFVLPTDKPNELILNLIQSKCSNNVLDINDINTNWYIIKYQNIYITNSEEIKEGDWCLDYENEVVKYDENKHNMLFISVCKKIILTTDQDLIADGVQKISDDFLEWFVKNPSCEKVEVEKYHQRGDVTFKDRYKIIIPKDEPNKTHYLDELPNMDREVLAKMWESAIPKLEPKQETVEEAAERIVKNKVGFHYFGNETSLENLVKKEYVIEGIKWQQERSYSEEEVLELLQDFANGLSDNVINIKSWFEQFKKK